MFYKLEEVESGSKKAVSSLSMKKEKGNVIEEVRERGIVEGVGTFLALQGGNIRVIFSDNTILYLDKNLSLAQIITNNGTSILLYVYIK